VDAGGLAKLRQIIADRGPIAAKQLEDWLAGPLTVVEAGHSQAEAVNAAVKAATGNYLAICEDDDRWLGTKLEAQLPLLESGEHDFVSCSQRELGEDGGFQRYNHFATPSGWLMKRETWEKVGGFDETFRYHVDNDWLGRANKAGIRRVHVIPAHAQDQLRWIPNVACYSKVVETPNLDRPLVDRVVTEDGGMGLIKADIAKLTEEFRKEYVGFDPAAFFQWALQKDSPAGVSMREHRALIDRYSVNPW
jgi:hypothetical protein